VKRLSVWVTGMVAGFYTCAISLAFFVIVLLLLSQVEISTEYELAMWEGTLGLSLIPVLLGLAILIISISGTLVSGTRFVNQGLAEDEKSHNPLWGVFLWFVPIFGLYKAFVMGKSIEKASGSEPNTTSKVSFGLFVSWLLGVVSEASSRTGLDPQSLFQVSLVLILLVTAIWFYMAVQAHNFLRSVRRFSSALESEERESLEIATTSVPIPDREDAEEKRASKFCTNCGQKQSLGSKFCGQCGSAFGG